MKHKRLLCIVFAIFTVLLSGCLKKQQYTFLYDVSEINQISIVYMTDANQVSNEYQTMFIIEDKDEFLEEFNKILFDKFLLGDPTHIHSDTYVILVEYKNGDCEFIWYYAQDKFISGDCYFGRVNCNKEEFDNFINSYLSLKN